MRKSLGRNCKKCGADDWYISAINGYSHCAACDLKYRSDKYHRNPRYYIPPPRHLMDPVRRAKVVALSRAQNWKARFRKHGLTLDEYHAMWESQGERCKLCSKVMAKGHIDHNHRTKRVRGLLCFNCNAGLGLFRDNPGVLRKAAAYVEIA